jgi:hypothetical protein
MPKIVHSVVRMAGVPAVAIGLILVVAQPALGHIVVDVGPYHLAIGWVREPVYVGEQNAVEVFVTNAQDKAVDDLTPDDLKVVVSNGGHQSDPLALTPTFDEDTGLGTRGDYLAPIIPTGPGDYTFHVTGSAHGTAIDQTATSSDSTFDSAIGPSVIQFPAKLPTLGEIATRLDRQDTRAQAAASDSVAARDAADRALTVGVAAGVAGVAGVAVGLAGLLVGWRALRRASRRQAAGAG